MNDKPDWSEPVVRMRAGLTKLQNQLADKDTAGAWDTLSAMDMEFDRLYECLEKQP